MTFKWKDISYRPYYQYCIETYKMIDYIDKYGINTTDAIGFNLCDYLSEMTKEQIDIVLFNPDFNLKYHVRLCYVGYGNGLCDYVLQMLLEHDHDGRYLHEQVCYSDIHFANVFECITGYLRVYKGQPFHQDHKRIKSLEYQKMLIENHKLKKTTLFNLMMPMIEERKTNKRQRVQ